MTKRTGWMEMPVPSSTGSEPLPDAPADELAAMVYEGDLHALRESQREGLAPEKRADPGKSRVELLRDAVWPFIR